MPPWDILITVGSIVCFGVEAWRSKSLLALGLLLLALALLF